MTELSREDQNRRDRPTDEFVTLVKPDAPYKKRVILTLREDDTWEGKIVVRDLPLAQFEVTKALRVFKVAVMDHSRQFQLDQRLKRKELREQAKEMSQSPDPS